MRWSSAVIKFAIYEDISEMWSLLLPEAVLGLAGFRTADG
jgi:hypothetical protein